MKGFPIGKTVPNLYLSSKFLKLSSVEDLYLNSYFE